MRFLNVHHARETIGRLAHALDGGHPSPDDLPAAYRRSIAGMRPIAPPAAGIRLSFKNDPWGRNLVGNKTFENIFEGLTPTPEDQRVQWGRDFKRAVVYTRDLVPDLGALVDLVVTDAVLFSSANKGGGSSSHLPGLISMSPGDDWTVHDFADSLVHEAVHLNVFLADMAYRLYTRPTKELGADGYQVVSAVKFGQMRPLDKAFHSAVVAPPLMFMQAKRGETELVDKFRASLRECTDGLLNKIEYFTPYGQLLVQELRAFTDDYDMDRVAESISGQDFAHWDLAGAA
ncbi:HEXXH motif-containing putative peptide modification protein [Streptomyces sp. NBC_00249]|uniref:aKG-HExxH-type peptide beta-hydroxylase n=1 Tax=Streptomyces sp. NBC_00249 TaxID=2975690 RepID=UPI002251D47C|nr:HEXXH motif-containing putative peptide modification protein [Streptomyces sp. NBC_00249]MCX5194851.1 HEXXH motif-containing putative peptide modification protein [Streptomyces sp. NBC_00249]